MKSFSFDSMLVFPEPEEEQVPSAPGVYAFFIDAFRPTSYGLYDSREPSEQQLASARTKMEGRYIALQRILSSVSAAGWIHEEDKARHLGFHYEVNLRQYRDGLPSEFAQVPNEQIPSYLRLLSSAWRLFPPIYIGMAREQTLRERYSQHRSAYESATSDQGGFGKTYRNSGFLWEDLVYVSIPVRKGVQQVENLRTAEKLLQSLGRPPFSKR